MAISLPAQNTQDQVKHKKRADDDERNKVDRVEASAEGIVGLKN